MGTRWNVRIHIQSSDFRTLDSKFLRFMTGILQSTTARR
jgi:hypothetical protein